MCYPGLLQNCIIINTKYFLFRVYKIMSLSNVLNSKQITTGLEGNRQIYLPPRDSGSTPQEFLLTEAQPRSIGTSASVTRNSWGVDPESQRTNRSAYYPRDQSLFVLLYHYVTQRKKIILIESWLVLPWVWSQKTHTFEWPEVVFKNNNHEK